MAGIVTSSKVIHPGSSPDVDSDFNTKIRTPVYGHVQDRYGADKVSNIATQARFGSKKAFKSMCTIYSIPPAAANRLTKLIPPPIEGVECKIADIFNPESSRYDEGAEFRSATQEDQWQEIIEGAIAIEGRISGTGAHACGVLLSSQPISSVVPTKVRKDDGRLLSQWAYPECESLGLVKMDFLGLDTVDLVQDAVEYIKRAGKEPPNMVNLIHGPMDDEKTYEMLRAGDTIGIFQLAGAGVQDLLRKMQPDSIDDIAAATALYRPGPMGMLSHVRYAERKSGREELGVPIHEDFVGSPLEEILKPTQNLCVFQEQVIQIANRIAGMTLQEGDDLRKAMGKKKLDVMAKMKPKFFEGARANNYSDEAVERLWDTIAEFGKYGFNRSHSYSYAIVAYQSAWLKANYPIEFMASLLATNVGDKDKILAFLKEARRMGITVGTADVNKSDVRVAPNLGDEGPDIVYGLSSISSVSESISEAIVKERNENGLYKSLTDFIDRTSAIGVARKNIFVALAHAGAFDSFGVTRKAVVEAVPHLMGDSKVKNKRGASLFDMFGSEDESLDYELGTEEYPFAEMVEHEAAVIGLYLTSHPLERVGKETSRLAETSIEKLLKSQEPRRKVKIAGAITDMESKIMQRGGKSITVTIDDGTGYLEARLTPDFVKAVDKGNAQASVKKLYMGGANKIADYAAKSLRSNVDAAPAIAKNRVYKMTIDFYPGEDGALPRVRLSDVTPVTLADDGTLPIRMRFDSGANKNAEKLRRALPKKIAEKWPGDSAIFVSEFDSTDPNAQNDAPQVYMDALEVIEKADDNAKKTPREWPPPQSGDPKDYAISTSLVELSDSVEYVDSGYRADKTKVVEMAIEKFLGAENYDFGALDESLFQ